MLKAEQIDRLITGKAVVEGDGWHQRMKAWHGLDPWDLIPCPRVAAGKRCTYTDCLCQFGGAVTSLLDHKGMWRTAERKLVFTAEPYTTSLDLDLLEEFRMEARQLGLTVRLSAASPWFPTRTVLLLVSTDWS